MAKLLCWDESLRPEGGSLVLRSVAGPLSIGYKEAAGIAFQTAILKQHGLLGAFLVGGGCRILLFGLNRSFQAISSLIAPLISPSREFIS